MASEEMGLVQAQRVDNGLNPHQQLVFPDSFTCGGPPPQRRSATAVTVGVPGPKATTAGYINHHHDNYYHHHHQPADFRRSIFAEDPRSSHQDSGHNWTSSSRGEGSEDEDDVDDDDVEDDNGAQGIVTVDNNKNNNNEKIKNNSNNGDAIGLREGNVVEQSGNEGSSDIRNAVTIEGGMYYPQQYLQGTEGSNGRQKDVLVENGVGFSGRKEGFYSSESGESLRAILSDPLTGVLMDDAMILPCGHSFGSGGMQHVLNMKACYTCSHAISEDSVAPNLSLRAAVQAFRREEELHVSRAPKKRREKYDQEKGTYGDSTPLDHPRGRGVQFPFAVTDRVIIKGNKRTPQRFVGREAIVTSQCLNGWYVVKTLDNAESVKLQYRSLTKVPDSQSSKPMSSKTTPHWL